MPKTESAVLDATLLDLPSPAESEVDIQLDQTWPMADLPVIVGGTTPPSVSGPTIDPPEPRSSK
jgi:hypothetical protein